MIMNKHVVVRGVFQGGGSGVAYLRFRDMSDDSPHGPGPGGVQAQAGPEYHRKIAPAAPGRKLGVPPLEEAICEVILEEVEAYVLRR